MKNDMTRILSNAFVTILITLAMVGCGDRDDFRLPGLDLMKPAALDDYLVYVDRANDQAFLLNVTGADLEPVAEIVDLPRNPVAVQKRKGAGHDELLILSRGQEESEDEELEEQRPSLSMLDGKGELRTYWLKASFNGLIQSDDGQYAFLYYDEEGPEVDSYGDITFEQNVTIVDLDQKAPGDRSQPYIELTAWDESVPEAVFFSPEMRIAGRERRLAVIMTETLAWFVDLGNDDAALVAFEPKIGRTTLPEQALFNPDAQQIYIRAANSDDVYIMDLTESTDASISNEFEITDTARAAGSEPTDLGLYDDDGLSRLLILAAGNNEAVVIDPDTSVDPSERVDDSSSWPVRIPLEAVAKRIILFEGGDPDDADAVEPRALLYTEGSGTIAFLDLSFIEVERQDNLQTIHLDRAYDRLITWDEDTVLLVNEESGISILDLVQRTITVIDINASLKVIPDRDVGKLWLAPSGNKRLRYISIGTDDDEDELDTGDVLLDEAIARVVPVTTGDRKRIVMEHDGEVGYVTIVDAREPSAKTATSLRGFFLADVLEDRGER
jgi:hypothetical protein